ncbi:MAG: tRNA (cytidine(34)-2'-O)-methyltransferase [Acidobacteria bacterium]|jgi:tRNA (cytidine/uridine-2'-O-)-methyltransferase|nr:tRNA (cytidine(34)-2'-O)-methyltransferase [Acidobacteriota bacterium]
MPETKNENTQSFNADVVLVEPEIPQNTGNIARTCAALGCKLHLIEPLGFSLTTQRLRRAGVDYWHLLQVQRYPNIETFFKTQDKGTFYFFTRKARRNYFDINFSSCGRVYFIFGKESTGLPHELISNYPGQCLRIPMRAEARSLNVSNAVAIALYEAFRQKNFPGLFTKPGEQQNCPCSSVANNLFCCNA